jgi:hypothetical protein
MASETPEEAAVGDIPPEFCRCCYREGEVRIRFAARDWEVPVENGYWLFALNDVPSDALAEVIAYRSGTGWWERLPLDPEAER